MGQVDQVEKCVTMDLKEPGNYVYQVGLTREELGGSHFALVQSLAGGQVPQVDPVAAKQTFAAVHEAINGGLVQACHDLSEGGLAVAAAEMAFAGNLGLRVFLGQIPQAIEVDAASAAELAALAEKVRDAELHPLATYPAATVALLFSESNTRFLCEVRPEDTELFEKGPRRRAPCAHRRGRRHRPTANPRRAATDSRRVGQGDHRNRRAVGR